MAAGSIVGSFIGGQLLGLVPNAVLLPLLALHPGAFSREGLEAQIKARRFSISCVFARVLESEPLTHNCVLLEIGRNHP